MDSVNETNKLSYSTTPCRDKVNYRIMISICDSDKSFAAGLKELLLVYFQKKGTDITFRESYSPGMPADFVFFSVPSTTCNKCRTIIEPAALSGTVFIPIKNEGDSFESKSQRCKPELESLAIYRNASVEDIFLKLGKVTGGDHGLQHKGACTMGGEKILSAREYEMILHMRTGSSQTEAAKLMGVNIKTVHTYKKSVMRKLGLKTKHDFMYWLLAMGNSSN